MANQTLRRADVPPDRRLRLQEKWRWLLAVGILWIVLGTLALVMPFVAAVSVELALGTIFLIGGVAQIVQSFQWRGWQGFALQLLGGAAGVVVGVLLLFYPLQGVLTLSIMLSAFFLVEGAFKILSALQHRVFSGWTWLLFSGIVGILIGILILAGWPGTALWALGLLVGIAVIFSGWSMVMLATSARCA